jgi:hypothetical protein
MIDSRSGIESGHEGFGASLTPNGKDIFKTPGTVSRGLGVNSKRFPLDKDGTFFFFWWNEGV